MEISFGLLKPDCLSRALERDVLAVIRAADLEIVAMRRVRLTKEDIAVIYWSCRDEDFYCDMEECYRAGDCLAFIVRGQHAICRLNNLVGHREPEIAEKHTIRHRYGLDIRNNVIHSTENMITFFREALLFFTRPELMELSIV